MALSVGFVTNTLDRHAKQNLINARLTGPEVFGLTRGVEIVTLFFSDNVTVDKYGLLVYCTYGELKNNRMRFSASLQQDVFNPIDHSILAFTKFYDSGNSGSYRGQLRFEHYFSVLR
jgi:hypothetical protein